jgi:hypothetical protein
LLWFLPIRRLSIPVQDDQGRTSKLQSALAEATQTDKKTAGVFLDALSAIAYKAPKRTANSSSLDLGSS